MMKTSRRLRTTTAACLLMIGLAAVPGRGIASSVHDVSAHGAYASGSGVNLAVNFRLDGLGPWPAGKLAGGVVRAALKDGEYVLRTHANEEPAFVGPSIAHLPVAQEGFIVARLRITGNGWAGVGGRYDAEHHNAYACVVNNSGKYGCFKQVNGTWTKLQAASTPLIKRKGYNNLSLILSADTLDFGINGKSVLSLVDKEPLTAGRWGVYVQARKGMTSASFRAIAVKVQPQ